MDMCRDGCVVGIDIIPCFSKMDESVESKNKNSVKECIFSVVKGK